MNNIENFLFDIDGTLLNDKSEFLTSEALVLSDLIDKKKKIYLVTGRNNSQLKVISSKLGAKIFNKINIVGCGGSYISNSKKCKILSNFSKSEQIEINSFAKENSLILFSYTPKYKFIYKKLSIIDYFKNILKFLLFKKEFCVNYNYVNKDICKYQLFDENVSLKMDFCSVYQNKNEIEILKNGVSKLTGVNEFKINSKNSIYFGDGENDIVCLDWAGMPVAMLNNDFCCNKSRYFVTTSSNNDGGVSEFLKTHNLF